MTVMKLLFTNKPRQLVPFVLLLVILMFAAVISVQAGVTNGLQVPPTSTPVPPSHAIQSGSDTATVYLPAVNGGAQPTDTPGSDKEFFISPSGDDGHSGALPNQAWATFEHAWTVVKAGDTVTMLDGTYTKTTIQPPSKVTGQPGNPITIRAQNDGQAIIDGQFVRQPVYTEYGGVDYHLVIEGIIARNSWKHAYRLNGNHTTLRRVSGYNADTDVNGHVFAITGKYNLVEDCVASGTGRKMVMVFKGRYNTIRRCHADWREWDGREWGSCWPWGDGLEFYSSSYNIMENSISYGHLPRAGISLLSQGTNEEVRTDGNKVLGTMSILSGMKHDGTPMAWGDTRPQPTKYTCVRDFGAGAGQLSGLWVGASGGNLHDNLLQDIFVWGSARWGITSRMTGPNPSYSNNHINRATVFNNGLDNIDKFGGIGAGADQEELAHFASIENSIIENIWTGSGFVNQNGEGARLTHRYVDGILTDKPLWPWPMEDRIKDELGYSVTCKMGTIINDAYAQGKAAEGIDMASRDPDWASDPNNLVVQACNN